jgi:chitin disaccharide deacetylase
MNANIKALLLFFIAFIMTQSLSSAPGDEKIRLIVRADDIGSSHAANRACIDSYVNGIARSVEIMVNCSWFPEAVEMLKDHPGYDVGVHLMLTSEWDMVKWRPLTWSPSLVDENGYFYPMIWPNDNYPPERTLRGAEWKLEEIEAELRAQIELAIKNIPRVSHLSTHMGFTSMDERVAGLVRELGAEYGLDIFPEDHGVKRMPGWRGATTLEEKIDRFIENLAALEPGTWMFVEHPAYDEPEMRATRHTGYDDVAIDRDHVTRVFTSEKVKAFIEERGIELISYKDLTR